MRLWMKDAAGAHGAIGTCPSRPTARMPFVYHVTDSCQDRPASGRGKSRSSPISSAESPAPGGKRSSSSIPRSRPPGSPLPEARPTCRHHLHPPLALSTPFALAPRLRAEPYREGEKYDLLIAANRFVTPPHRGRPDPGDQGDSPILSSTGLSIMAPPRILITSSPGFAHGPVHVTLKFAEIVQNAPGMRVFDIALNGKTVLKDFDVFAAAGGKFIAFDTAFTVPSPDGILRMTVPRVAAGSARICAMKLATRRHGDRGPVRGHPYRGHERTPLGVLPALRPDHPDVVLPWSARARRCWSFRKGKGRRRRTGPGSRGRASGVRRLRG